MRVLEQSARGSYTCAMKISVLFRCALLVLLFCAGASAFAQWVWLDKDGRKVYSDRAPPPEITDQRIVKRPPQAVRGVVLADPDAASVPAGAASAPLPVASAPKPSSVDKDLEARKKAQQDALDAKKKADEARLVAAKADNCARARQNKMALDSGQRISHINAAGQPEILDDAARQAEAQRLQGIISSDCS